MDDPLPIELNVGTLLSGKYLYLIPRYQRNYSWGRDEIGQLIQDVMDYAGRKGPPAPYYLGTLVVHEHPQSEGGQLETIDGQQRLTTLSLLAAYLRRKELPVGDLHTKPVIGFQSREQSGKVLVELFDGEDPARIRDRANTLTRGYEIIVEEMRTRVGDTQKQAKFASYLMGWVKIFQVRVPPDTDLNHYFEIMNSRGEQLEKHEILKSRLIEPFNGAEDKAADLAITDCFARIWDACSNMRSYVQMGFPKKLRPTIFGAEWSDLMIGEFDQLLALMPQQQPSGGEREPSTPPDDNSLAAILNPGFEVGGTETTEPERPDRFHSVVNFSNFLLHVLRVWEPDADIRLDDKHLLDQFHDCILKESDLSKRRERTKKFLFTLLRARLLFDQYILKSELTEGPDHWSLRRMKCYTNDSQDYVNAFWIGEEGEKTDPYTQRILMLQSAFHVSNPSMSYKHWLSAAMVHLMSQGKPQGEAFLRHLEDTAKAFIYDRYLTDGDGRSFSDITFQRNEKRPPFNARTAASKLRFHATESIFVFNYLDYLLWVIQPPKEFRFTSRSSVEHHAPQNPEDKKDGLDPEPLHSFGNLYLTTPGKNSRMSNFSAEIKRGHFLKSGTIDSLKQQLMLDYPVWGAASVADHEEQMIKIFRIASGASTPFEARYFLIPHDRITC